MDQPRKKLIQKLRYKYRMVIINDESFEEKLNFKLTPMNVFVGFSSAVVLLTFLVITLIFYTSLREYVPGYTDSKTKRNLQQLLYKTDSLEQVLVAKELYYKNIVNILGGGEGLSDSIEQKPKPTSDLQPKIGQKQVYYSSFLAYNSTIGIRF
jgi:hypothetical protein